MPYKDPEQQRAYMREWIAKRRNEWLAENGPCVDCKSWEDLNVDHIDPTQKVTHRVWSWTKVRRDTELEKCVVRCEECHKKRHRPPIPHGTETGYSSRECRCLKCKAAHAIYRQEVRSRSVHVLAPELRTHCPQGHEYNEENTYFYKKRKGKTGRGCSICRRQQSRDRYKIHGY